MQMIKNIILVMAMFFIASCSDNFLNVYPTDKLSDATFWKDEKDADLALAGVYNQFEFWWNPIYWDMASDNGYSQFPWENFQNWGNGNVNPTSIGYSFYDFNLVTRANTFLENIDNVPMDESKKKRYIAEVRFLRAYDYYRKVMWHGDIPLITKTFDSPSESIVPRTPKSEVVAFILSELEAASTDLPKENNVDSKGHATAGAAIGLKARLELYEGANTPSMYAAAATDAKRVMDMGVYALFNDYPGIFLVDNETVQTETILDVQYMKDVFWNQIYRRFFAGSVGGWSSLSATQSIVDAYGMTNGKAINEAGSGYDEDHPFADRDPRLDYTILYSGKPFNGSYYSSIDQYLPGNVPNPNYWAVDVGPDTGYNIAKYYDPSGSSNPDNGGANVIVMRLSEMYLTYAEGKIESNAIDQSVLDAINTVRARAYNVAVGDVGNYPAVTTTNQAELRTIIRNERRVELAFEGLRYFDVKRWDLGPTVLNGPLMGARKGSVDFATGEVTYATDRLMPETRNFFPNRNYLLPIPQSQMDLNPELNQNPGY